MNGVATRNSMGEVAMSQQQILGPAADFLPLKDETAIFNLIQLLLNEKVDV